MATKINITLPDLRFDLEKQLDIATLPLEKKTPSQTSRETGGTFAWRDVAFSVDTKKGKKQILQNVSGYVERGQLLALMGPSGCGKTTLLNILSRRLKGDSVGGDQFLGGSTFDDATLRAISTYVEQEDHLIGSLTVKETLLFAAKLALPGTVSPQEREERAEDMLREFGLISVSDSKIGTPIQRGISGGQKRRVTTASQLITLPKIIFLDEPTSGLDSTAAHEIISCLSSTAREYGMIVIASIHQPSTNTLLLFDNVLLLSEGQMAYFGPPGDSIRYFKSLGYPEPQLMSPAEFMLELANTDFVAEDQRESRLDHLVRGWGASRERRLMNYEISLSERNTESLSVTEDMAPGYPRTLTMQSLILLHRIALKSYRDPLAYGVRAAMYLGLAILMGTAWLRLSYSQENIQNVANALYFASAFTSFMAVAYIPAFLEDRSVMVKERANGLYSVTAFLIANTIIGIPFLAFIAFLFSIVSYFLINLHPGASPFMNYFAILFLNLVAAEALVVLISAIFPIFVVALALTAFSNGLWMSVGGFLVTPNVLNVFWKYTFYQIDYQRYAFSALVINQMAGSVYTCGSSCECQFVTSLALDCLIDGSEAAQIFGYDTSQMLLIVIAIGMRCLAWLALYLRRK